MKVIIDLTEENNTVIELVHNEISFNVSCNEITYPLEEWIETEIRNVVDCFIHPDYQDDDFVWEITDITVDEVISKLLEKIPFLNKILETEKYIEIEL
jgi:hypothetical protein